MQIYDNLAEYVKCSLRNRFDDASDISQIISIILQARTFGFDSLVKEMEGDLSEDDRTMYDMYMNAEKNEADASDRFHSYREEGVVI